MTKESLMMFFQEKESIIVFLLILCIRIVAALVVPISDCDETFNYWEPLHYIVHGRGLQTWEFYDFCPKHLKARGEICAIQPRVCTTILCLSPPSQLPSISIWGPQVYQTTLILLSTSSGMFLQAVSFLPSTTCLYVVMWAYALWLEQGTSCSAVSPGKKGSNPAERRPGMIHTAPLYWGAFCVLLVWPFCALLFVPIGVHALVYDSKLAGSLWRLVPSRCGHVARVTFISICLFFLLPSLLDSLFFYGKMVFPLGNLVMYNVAGAQGDGADLYGTEPFSYYLVNLFLNVNLALVGCAMLLPMKCVVLLLQANRTAASPAPNERLLHNSQINAKSNRSTSTSSTAISTPPRTTPATLSEILLYCSGLYITLFLFFSMAHKEERFLTMCYPLMCLSAALCEQEVRVLCSLFPFPSTSETSTLKTNDNATSTAQQPRVLSYCSAATTRVRAIILLLSVSLSLSRSLAMVLYFQAPRQLFEHIYYAAPLPASLASSDISNPTTICMGKEWYRFPSSFFLHEYQTIRWIDSGFRGLLPQAFPTPTQPKDSWTSKVVWRMGTSLTPQGLNNVNRVNPAVFVRDAVDECDIIVDFVPRHHCPSPNDTRSSTSHTMDTRSSTTPEEADTCSSTTSAHHCQSALITDTSTFHERICVNFLNSELSLSPYRAYYLPPQLLSWLSSTSLLVFDPYCVYLKTIKD